MGNNQPSRARAFFEAIMQAGDDSARAAYIRSFVNAEPQKSEFEYLEFKNHPKEEKHTAEYWSKALGGFANTEGGVLVWGIDARKGRKGADAAGIVTLVPNPAAFVTRLNEFQQHATSRPIPGVEKVPILDAAEPGKGFVVCYIPEGNFKPYRSERAGQQWYQRVNDRFEVINPAVLGSLFYPRLQPQFSIKAWLSYYKKQAEDHIRAVMNLFCVLENVGTATAKELRVKIIFSAVRPKFGPEVDFRLHDERDGITFLAHQSLHPGLPVGLCQAEWNTPLTSVSMRPLFPEGGVVWFVFSLFAENAEPQEIILEFGDKELLTTDVVEAVAISKPIDRTRPHRTNTLMRIGNVVG